MYDQVQRQESGEGMTLFMDTYRMDAKGITVTCYTNLQMSGEYVSLSVTAFGRGREGTDNAFDKMEKVLAGLGHGDTEKVRVY